MKYKIHDVILFTIIVCIYAYYVMIPFGKFLLILLHAFGDVLFIFYPYMIGFIFVVNILNITL